MYFSQAASEESLREKKARLDAQRDAAVICDNCGELTVYSIPLILPGGMKNMVCLSDKCITNSILHTGDTIVEEEESRTEYDDLFFEWYIHNWLEFKRLS